MSGKSKSKHRKRKTKPAPKPAYETKAQRHPGGRARFAAVAGGFAPFFAPAPEKIWWQGFAPCLLAAFALRVGVGLSGDWMVRPDEVFKYLEQAHRLVFGYGQTVWEFTMGVVTWLLPAVPALPMFLCKILGLGHPDFYIPAVKIWNALLSLSLPAGMYLFGRRVMSERTARLALLFGCFWHEFIIFSTHALAEQYAAVAFFSALMLLSSAASAPRLLSAGFLLGLTAALRFQYLPLVGVFGLALLAAYPLARWRLVFIGGTAAVVLWGAVDYWTWGGWWSPFRLYLNMFLVHDFYTLFSRTQLPFYQQLLFLAGSSYGLYALAAAALFRWRLHWLLLSMAAAVLLVHMWAVNKEYSTVFLLLPLLWMLIASVTGDFRLPRFRRGAAVAAGMLAALASVVSFSNGVPNLEKAYNAYDSVLMPDRKGLLHSEEPLIIARDVARIPADEVRSVMLMPFGTYKDGAYYHSHHRVPMLFPNRNPDHAAWYKERPAKVLASHVVTWKDKAPRGFSLVRDYGQLALFVNDTPEAVRVPDNFALDYGTAFDRMLMQRARDMGIAFREPGRALLFPGEDGAAQGAFNW